MILSSDDFIRALNRQQKQVSIKLELYDSNDNFIREITQSVNKDSAGSISVDSERDIRRSFSFSLVNKNNEYTYGTDKLVWLDKRVKLYIGLKLLNGTTEYVPQGYFIVTSPSTSHDTGGSITNLTGQDKAYLYTGNLGKFIYQTKIATGLKITEAIKIIAPSEKWLNFDDITDVVPYELTYEPNSNKWEAMKQLAELAKCAIYYDVNGYLRLKKIELENFQNQSTVWNFTVGDRFYAGNVRTLQDENLYNHVIVLGGGSQTAVVSKEIKVTETNPKWKDNPYRIEKIGWRPKWHNEGTADPIITTDDLALWRAKWMLMKYLGYVDSVQMPISPHYLLDADDIINIEDPVNGVTGRHMIKSLDIPLSPALMTVNCSKENKFITDWNFM
ncbi:hypothetical protein AB1283_25950 [Bacillus sp. S13(2024)]|uniref:hypothetical protein n=1 Tax=Bacillus sp. S13(2024) TaxID=3162885 RepID=UPI003D2602C9